MRTIPTAVMLAMLLSACQSIFGHRAELEVRPIGPESTASRATAALEDGRKHLTRGEVASAIVSLQIAAAKPETAAAAHNGLAVAYAMLDRSDVAERYFNQAVAENPAEPKYAANLARFNQSREAALARNVARSKIEISATTYPADGVSRVPATHAIQAGPSVVHVSGPAQEALTRVSRQEVTIRTAPPGAALALADPRRPNPRYVATRPARQPNPYPLRIKLARLTKR